ncbi:hypothetical protein LCGC14_2550560, partial [marine sediment metagenome]
LVTVPMLTYYRSSTKLTGNLLSPFLQKVESVIIPQEVYTPLIKAYILTAKNLFNALMFSK